MNLGIGSSNTDFIQSDRTAVFKFIVLVVFFPVHSKISLRLLTKYIKICEIFWFHFSFFQNKKLFPAA